MKCRTTSLRQYLREHPQVCVSNPKETDFFLERNKKDRALPTTMYAKNSMHTYRGGSSPTDTTQFFR
ncbi:hypothetical protein GGQ00_003065 [Salinibacter ruber]|nr:hypothetical protein [Salinibacter ruber]